ncbi:SpoU [Desulforapulum autotrophicum HRM2]|uniref:SpoU n=1 Tax=Desulforapulum autotrophicum (strain ATCC 43914 / DSM 3382 / VKM B-1955 / HRM2) TaxID=177437 RepID=C0QAQ0_DESAH|nr:RNA methyltransferase [Desulforapulum autotrophicum]ACN16833.1 SpoU [Desulforapulum autotrophicum HRM2]
MIRKKDQILTFPFTQKKFMALTPQGRHGWIVRWLSGVYQEILTNRVTPRGLEFFAGEYARITGWSETWPGKIPNKIPHEYDARPWLEFISNAIHIGRTARGISPKDPDLLPPATTRGDHKDRTGDRHDRPLLDFHIALDGLRSLFNVGSIFRSCDAAGFSSLILGNTPGRENAAVRKTAMGTADWMPHTQTVDLAQTLVDMKAQGYTITAVETAEQSKPYHDNDWHHRGVLVVGNEEYGISSHVLAVCDQVVHIPMFGRKNSLNVANAAAILMFHITTCLHAGHPDPGQHP